jgi:FkbM family methyltransferase
MGLHKRFLENLWEIRIFAGLAQKYRVLSPASLRRVAETEYLQNPPEFITTRFGFKIYLNPIDRGVSAVIGGYGLFEPKVTYLFRRLLFGARLVVNIGANIGWFTLLAARRGITTYSFEPGETNFRYPCKSLEANCFANVRAFPYAIWNKDGEVDLSITDSDNRGTHSVVLTVGKRKVRVVSKKLDTLFPSETIDVLKLDAEGAEPEVLLGAESLIRERRVKHIVMEWTPKVWEGREQVLSPFRIRSIDSKGKDHNLSLVLR